MKIYAELIQGSEEWKSVRRGMITGSRLKDVFKADNLGLVDELIAEKISDEVEEMFQNAAMKRGTEMEPIARKAYEEESGNVVTQVGFCVSNKFSFLGLSPDGLIETDLKYKKGLEIKCPNTATHVKYIRMNKIPSEYKYQILDYFLVCQDMESLDFVSYDDRFSTKPLHIITITRKELEEDLQQAEIALEKFWKKFELYYKAVVFG
jgi:putative phage-type endonuclease